MKTTNNEVKSNTVVETVNSTLINKKALSVKQMSVVNAYIAFFDNMIAENIMLAKKRALVALDEENKKRLESRLYKQDEMRYAAHTLYNAKYAAQFIIKNTACKRAQHVYDLKCFKLSSDAAKELAASANSTTTDASSATKSVSKTKKAASVSVESKSRKSRAKKSVSEVAASDSTESTDSQVSSEETVLEQTVALESFDA